MDSEIRTLLSAKCGVADTTLQFLEGFGCANQSMFSVWVDDIRDWAHVLEPGDIKEPAELAWGVENANLTAHL